MGVNQVVFGSVKIMDISDSTVTADSMMAGDVAYGADGEKVVGTFSLDNEIDTSENLVDQIQAALVGKAAGGGGGSNIRCAYIYDRSDYAAVLTVVFNEGSTWGEYIESDLNNGIYVLSSAASTSSFGKLLIQEGSYVMHHRRSLRYVSTDGTSSGRVTINDIIESGRVYTNFNNS